MPGSLARKHSRFRGEKPSARGTSTDVQPSSSPRKCAGLATPSSRRYTSSVVGAGCSSLRPKTRYQRLIASSVAHLTDRSGKVEGGLDGLLLLHYKPLPTVGILPTATRLANRAGRLPSCRPPEASMSGRWF